MEDDIKQFDFYREEVQSMCLGSALNKYYLQNPGFTPYHALSSNRARRLVRAHDITHLIFGCATDDEGELRVQLWTRYGVEINLSFIEKIRYFFNIEALKLVLNFDALWFSLNHHQKLRQMNSEVKKRAKQMTRKWQYLEEDIFMDRTIDELRNEFNILIV